MYLQETDNPDNKPCIRKSSKHFNTSVEEDLYTEATATLQCWHLSKQHKTFNEVHEFSSYTQRECSGSRLLEIDTQDPGKYLPATLDL